MNQETISTLTNIRNTSTMIETTSNHSSSYSYSITKNEVNSFNNSNNKLNKRNSTNNRRFSVLETEKWKDVFTYSSASPSPTCIDVVCSEISEIDSIGDEVMNTHNSNNIYDKEIHEEDAQWREIFGCRENHRNRVVSAPLPINQEKVNGFLKRKSDPVKLPSASSRRPTIVETEAWKDMFLCDDSKINLRSSGSTEPLQNEDEHWRDFFGCNDNLPRISSPRSPPLKNRPNQKLQNSSSPPPVSLTPITERDSETGSSSNSSGELPPSKLFGYLSSFMKLKPSKKR